MAIVEVRQVSPLSSEAHAGSNGSMGVTYGEVRWWAVWLQYFTASDLADAMGVDVSIGERSIRALLWHGICEETGDQINGPYGLETIIRYKPLPAGPRNHPVGELPEVIAVREMGGPEILSPRGMPVRIRTDRDTRKNLSTPGTRHKMKLAEMRYQQQMEARQKRAEMNKSKAQKEPKWKRRK